MEEFGREMLQNCAGLPLAIVVLGGILVTKPSFYEWEKVYYDSQSSLKRGKGLDERHQEEVFDILRWSYKVLPSQLKLCFLYMGKFAEDEEIEAETLYQLWIAEGLVLSSDKREGETMKQVAESYMKELVHKSMVQVKYEDDIYPERKIKYCQLHDLMRDLSMSVAEGEDFYKVVVLTEAASSSPELTSSTTRQLVVNTDAEGVKNIRNHPILVKKYNQGRARSVLVCSSNDDIVIPITILGLHFESFMLLRVFVLEGVDFLEINLRKILGRLIHLRYLSLAGENLVMFSFIQKFEQLQTLKLHRWSNAMYLPSSLPRNILSNLRHLRHLYLPKVYMYKNKKLGFDGLSKLETLENFDTRWCEVKDLPKLISLQKLLLRIRGNYKEVEEMIKYLSSYSGRYLSVYIYIKDDQVFECGADMWRQFFRDHRYNLQELGITGKLPELVKIFGQQLVDVSLIHITILSLWHSSLSEDPMPILERFPMLRRLGIYWAYAGVEMVCSVLGFPKLTDLRLQYLPNLEKWRAEEGSMPILEYLTIEYCSKLKELPERLKDLPRAPLLFGIHGDGNGMLYHGFPKTHQLSSLLSFQFRKIESGRRKYANS